MRRTIRGDFQTPAELARAVCAHLAAAGLAPAAVLEPTCGRGAFLAAAGAAFPGARRVGFDVDPDHVAAAAAVDPGARVEVADAFTVDWERELARLPQPLLILGNPPWVTSAALGKLGVDARPARGPVAGVAGLDALTGRSNFDVSEWILRRLLAAAAGRDFTLAMLCKLQVARRLIAGHPALGGELRHIDAGAAFGASVAATLLIARPDGGGWHEYAAVDADRPLRQLGLIDGELVADAAAARRTAALAGRASPPWRSGVKHDCAAVLELDTTGDLPRNRAGEAVDVEAELLHPLLKGGDLVAGRLDAPRALLLPQRHLGEDTAGLRERAPRAWAYLEDHAAAFAARRSRIYRGRPRFAVFGVGDYSFAPWKVAVSGLHKQLAFALLGPRDGRPVLVDDTCYFLPFADEAEARAAHDLLCSPAAAEFLNARIFWDAKRPIHKAVLDRLDLGRLAGLARSRRAVL